MHHLNTIYPTARGCVSAAAATPPLQPTTVQVQQCNSRSFRIDPSVVSLAVVADDDADVGMTVRDDGDGDESAHPPSLRALPDACRR